MTSGAKFSLYGPPKNGTKCSTNRAQLQKWWKIFRVFFRKNDTTLHKLIVYAARTRSVLVPEGAGPKFNDFLTLFGVSKNDHFLAFFIVCNGARVNKEKKTQISKRTEKKHKNSCFWAGKKGPENGPFLGSESEQAHMTLLTKILSAEKKNFDKRDQKDKNGPSLGDQEIGSFLRPGKVHVFGPACQSLLRKL